MRISRLLFILAGLVFCGSLQAQPLNGPIHDLFEEVDSRTRPMGPQVIERVDHIKGQQITATVRAVGIPAGQAIARHQRLRFRLETGRAVVARALRVEIESPDAFVWVGELEAGEGDVTLAYRERRITGSIRVGEEQYQIQPLDAPLHAFVRLDPSKFPLPESPDWNPTA